MLFSFLEGSICYEDAIHPTDLEECAQARGHSYESIFPLKPLRRGVHANNRAQGGRVHVWHVCQVDYGHRGVTAANNRLKLEDSRERERAVDAKYADSLVTSWQ